MASACIRPGLRNAPPSECSRYRAVEQVEAGLGQHHHGDDHAAGHQQAGLDDLHPRGGEHAAEDHVDDHEGAGEHHRPGEVDARQRLDHHAGADHLREQVEEGDRQRAERGGQPRGPLLHAEGQDVGHREPARVAHALGEQEEHRHEGHQRADEADEAVEAEEEDQAGEAEERRGRHVVAGDREAVLASGDAAAGGPELVRGAGALGRPVGDAERDGENDGEDRQSQLVHDTRSRSAVRSKRPLGSRRLAAIRCSIGDHSRSLLRRYANETTQVDTISATPTHPAERLAEQVRRHVGEHDEGRANGGHATSPHHHEATPARDQRAEVGRSLDRLPFDRFIGHGGGVTPLARAHSPRS